MVLLPALTFSQTEIFRTFSTRVLFEHGEWETYEGEDALIFWNLDEKVIDVKHPYFRNTYFYTNTGEMVENDVDEDGDEYTVFRMIAYDLNGEEVVIVTKDWLDLPFTLIQFLHEAVYVSCLAEQYE